MKKILILLLLISSIASAQGDRYRPVFKLVGMEVAYWAPIPRYTNISARYKWIATAVDSGLHIPQYNGVPSGVRVGNWEADGAIAMDTLNGYFYCYSGGVWIKMAKFSDVGSAYTAGYGLALTGTVFRADTAVLNGLVGIQRAITNNGAITNVSNITGLLANDLNFKWDATSYFSFTNATDPVLDIYMVGVPAGFGTSVSSFTEFAPDVITFGVDGPSSTFADLIANYDGGVSGSATLRAGRGGINFTVNAFSTGTAGATSVLTLQGTKSGATSSIDIYPDSLRLLPHLGQLSIDTLTNLSTQNTLLGWKQGSGQGQVGYITLGAGLSLASGVLTNTGLTATPGLQDVITEDPVLTTNNTIDAGSTLFKIKLDEDNDFTGFEGLNYGSIIGFQNGLALVKQGSGASSSSLQVVTGSSTLSSATAAATSNIVITPTSVSINPHLSNLLIDSLNYTLSTVRKKIMLRDTVTGLVENIDPSLLTGGGGITVGTTTITSGTDTRILYDNAGVVGEYTLTGTGTVVAMQTSPSFVTSVIGGASFDAFNTVSTVLNIGGAANTLVLGGTSVLGVTHYYSPNTTPTGVTKTVNFATGGASGSTTALNIGSYSTGAANNIKLSITPTSDATGDMFYRNSSGFLERLPIGTAAQHLTGGTIPVWKDTATGGGSQTPWTSDIDGDGFDLFDVATIIATTSITSPLILGGSATSSDLILQTTSGVGATGADMLFKVGNNGSVEAAKIYNSGAADFNSFFRITGAVSVSPPTGEGVEIEYVPGSNTGYIASYDRGGGNYGNLEIGNAQIKTFLSTMQLNSNIIVNNNSVDFDFQLKGDNQANVIFVDASVDMVGFTTGTPTSTVHVNGSFATAYTAQSGTYPITASDYSIEATSGTWTATLPTAVGCTGRMYFITNSGAGTITVATTSSQVFRNVVATPTTLTLATLTGVLVQSNGGDWLKISSF